MNLLKKPNRWVIWEIMAGTIFSHGAIKVFIAAEDHPPPHVHAHHPSEGWTARFRFSFLSDVTGLYRFKRRQHRPTVGTLNDLADAIMQHLPACREEWWNTHGHQNGIGLINQRIETRAITTGDMLLAKVPLKPDRNMEIITSASYNIRNEKVSLSISDGRKLLLTAGQHIEEAREW